MNHSNLKFISFISTSTYDFTCLSNFQELGTKFEFVGYGICMSRCHAIGDPCFINYYGKGSSNIDECRLACVSEVACTGFAISTGTAPNLNCFLFGNISSVNVERWANPDAWTYNSESTYGYEGFKVNSTDNGIYGYGYRLTRCFKRLDEGQNNDGKFLEYLWPVRGLKYLNLRHLYMKVK